MDSSSVVQNAQMMTGVPAVKIIEQPARCALRFRYECEGRSAGSIPGANATPENKTFPTIQVVNYKGPAVVVVSCVTKDSPYRPHPHNLVGKEGCKKGVCTIVINNPEMTCSFTSLGIQCVKRKDVEDSLKLRESIKVDPFRTGFGHKSQSSNIDLNVVRLCFQVFIEGEQKEKFTVPLPPVVCDPIYDKKAMSELTITKLSHCSAPVSGGKEVILLCDRVTKDDVQVRFYEERDGQVLWEGFGEFQPNDVHKQVAICFKTPRYFDETIQQPVTVQLMLRRPSDMQASDSRPFIFMPRDVDPNGMSRKRQKMEEGPLDRYFRENNIILHPPAPIQEQKPDAMISVVPQDFQIRVPRFAPKVKHETPEEQSSSSNQQQQQPTWIFPQDKPKSDPFAYNPNIPFGGSTVDTTPVELKQKLGIKQETGDSASIGVSRSQQSFSGIGAEALTDGLNSLDLDIDPIDLISDFNYNNLTVPMDSGNNITFDSTGNITIEPGPSFGTNLTGSLNTPHILDISDSHRHPLGTAAQMNRLQPDMQYIQQQNQLSSKSDKQ